MQRSGIDTIKYDIYIKPNTTELKPHTRVLYAENEFNMFAELNLDFTQEEVLNAVKQLKLNKSGGPDMLINEFSIYGKHIFTSTLFYLFNQIFASGQMGTSYPYINKAV